MTVPGVQIAAVGTWRGLTGEFTLTREHLEAAVEASRTDEFNTARLKLGHTDPRFDGMPALGAVQNLRVEGDVLVGDYVDVPAWMAKDMHARYPSRSLEGRFNARSARTGKRHKFVVDRVALLGAEPPAIESLDDLQQLMEEGPIAASADHGSQVFGVFTPVMASAPASGHTNEEAPMTAPAVLEALGLSEDATEEQAIARAKELAEAANTDGGDGEATPTEADENATDGNTGNEPAPAPVEPPAGDEVKASALKELVELAKEHGLTLVDNDRLAKLEANSEQGVAARRAQLEGEREALLETAVKAGKFENARVGHFRKLYDVDPEGTKAVIASLADNTVPVAPLGETVAASAGHDAYPIGMFPELVNRDSKEG